MQRISKIAASPNKIPPALARKWRAFAIRINNAVKSAKRPGCLPLFGLKEMGEIQSRALLKTDASDHLMTYFVEALSARPRLIVELGVRGGESTYVFERVARLCRGALLSVDLQDCLKTTSYPGAHFVRSDDIAFAGRFEAWCSQHNLKPEIDVLLIDSSHLYDHTVQEIDCWFPFLPKTAKVFFHDTNLQEIFERRDGTRDFGWDNDRGVIRALEKFFNQSFNEKQDFVDYRSGWLIKHVAICNGLTILEKFTLPEGEAAIVRD